MTFAVVRGQAGCHRDLGRCCVVRATTGVLTKALQAPTGIRTLSIIPPPGVGRGTDRILDRLEFLSDRRAASISNEDREDLLGPFHRDCRVEFQVLFAAIAYKDELRLGEAVEDIDNPLAFSSCGSRQETIEQ